MLVCVYWWRHAMRLNHRFLVTCMASKFPLFLPITQWRQVLGTVTVIDKVKCHGRSEAALLNAPLDDGHAGRGLNFSSVLNDAVNCSNAYKVQNPTFCVYIARLVCPVTFKGNWLVSAKFHYMDMDMDWTRKSHRTCWRPIWTQRTLSLTRVSNKVWSGPPWGTGTLTCLEIRCLQLWLPACGNFVVIVRALIDRMDWLTIPTIKHVDMESTSSILMVEGQVTGHFPDRTFPWDMFNELIREGLTKKLNQWLWLWGLLKKLL